jgi:hypothetical protein
MEIFMTGKFLKLYFFKFMQTAAAERLLLDAAFAIAKLFESLRARKPHLMELIQLLQSTCRVFIQG